MNLCCRPATNWQTGQTSEGVMTVLEWLSIDCARANRKTAEFELGVLIFCAIGLLLSLVSMLFGWFGLAGPSGF
jgi:hypothetical protein